MKQQEDKKDAIITFKNHEGTVINFYVEEGTQEQIAFYLFQAWKTIGDNNQRIENLPEFFLRYKYSAIIVDKTSHSKRLFHYYLEMKSNSWFIRFDVLDDKSEYYHSHPEIKLADFIVKHTKNIKLKIVDGALLDMERAEQTLATIYQKIGRFIIQPEIMDEIIRAAALKDWMDR